MDMLVSKNNNLEIENKNLNFQNESLRRENNNLKKDRRILQGKIELLAHFVKQTEANYAELLDDFLKDKNDSDKKLYKALYIEFKKYDLF